MTTATRTRRPLLRDWARVGGLLWRVSPGLVVAVTCCTAAVALVPAAQLQLTALSVQAVADGVAGDRAGGTLARVVTLGAVLAGVMLFAHLVSALNTYFSQLLRLKLMTDVGEQLMVIGTELDLATYEDPESYDLLQRAYQESSGGRLHQLFADLLEFLRECATVLAVAAVLVSWNPWLALLILLAPVPAALAQMVYGQKMFEIEYARAADRRRLMYLQFLTTTDHTFKEVRLLGLGPYLIERYRAIVRQFLRTDADLTRRQCVALAVLGALTTLASAGAVLYALTSTLAGGQLGELVGYLQAITTVSGSVQTLLMSVGSLFEASLFVGNLFALFDLPRRPPASGPRAFPNPVRQGIEFRDVTFRYPGTDRAVLDHLNLVLPAGRCTALVGENGSGKTTMVKLLSRLYEPTEGTILLDGVPLSEYDTEDLRANLGVIFQDFVKYEMSARHNVGFGRVGDLDDQDALDRAVRAGGAEQILDRLPAGYESSLGRHFENGNQLSGGEWQRIALSRAFMRAAPVVVLDEPTAAIDAESEEDIFRRFRSISRSTTSVLIAHRFSTVRMADSVAVIQHGRIIEQGTHEELVASGGRYAYLFRLQAAGYTDDSTGRTSGSVAPQEAGR